MPRPSARKISWTIPVLVASNLLALATVYYVLSAYYRVVNQPLKCSLSLPAPTQTP